MSNTDRSGGTRVAIILLAIVSVVLAVVFAVNKLGEEKPTEQADLSGYGISEPTQYGGTSGSDDVIYEDDGTTEMDSIPNEAVSGGDVSGTDVGAAQ